MANTKRTLARALFAIGMVLIVGFASVACAAMVSQSAADSHPCCPKHGNAGSNPCVKTGCVSNVPALRTASTGFAIALPVLAQVLPAPAARSSVREGLSEANLHLSDPDVFLKNHALLI